MLQHGSAWQRTGHGLTAAVAEEADAASAAAKEAEATFDQSWIRLPPWSVLMQKSTVGARR